MTGYNSWVLTAFSLTVMIFIAGCATIPASSPAPTTVPFTVIQTVPPTTIQVTTAPVTATITTPRPTATFTEQEILHDSGILTTKTYKTYDFKDLGFKFVYPFDAFRITIKSEKPVLGYALNTEQAGRLQGSQLIPHYESYSKKVQWGLIDPSFVLEKATDSTGEYVYGNYIRADKDGVDKVWNKGEVHPLTYVVDGRWMGYDPVYDNIQQFTYEITITKTGGPTKQSFDFRNVS
jgi:hypothetical protein